MYTHTYTRKLHSLYLLSSLYLSFSITKTEIPNILNKLFRFSSGDFITFLIFHLWISTLIETLTNRKKQQKKKRKRVKREEMKTSNVKELQYKHHESVNLWRIIKCQTNLLFVVCWLTEGSLKDPYKSRSREKGQGAFSGNYTKLLTPSCLSSIRTPLVRLILYFFMYPPLIHSHFLWTKYF